MPTFKKSTVHRWGSIGLTFLSMGLISDGAHAADYAKAYVVTPRSNVYVDTNDADVKVTAGNTMQVEFRVAYSGLELDKTLHIESHQQGDEVELNVRVADNLPFFVRQKAKVHIEVRVPKDGSLRVNTSDGSVRADGLSGTIDLQSEDGSLVVHSLAGKIGLHTRDGSVDGSDLDGQCDASSGDGSIRIAGRFDVLKVKSGDGSISVAAGHGSRIQSSWDIDSGDGGIDVALPTDLSLDIDASSRDGRVRSDIPISMDGNLTKSRVRGKLNGGGQPLTIHSGDGSIRLRSV